MAARAAPRPVPRTQPRTPEELARRADELDRQIVELLAERGRCEAQAARAALAAGELWDPERLEKVVEKVRAHAERAGAEPDIVEVLYRDFLAGLAQLGLAGAGEEPAPERAAATGTGG